MSFEHPSFLALDQHALRPKPVIAEHLTQCAQCRAHVQRLADVPPLPSGVAARRAGKIVPWRPMAAGAALALAASIAVVVATRFEPRETPTSTSKGTQPSARLWLKRGDEVWAWQGGPVHAQEALRFEVNRAGFEHLWVVAMRPTPHVLYEAAASGPSVTMTPAWEIDDEGTTEEFAVLLTHSSREPSTWRCESNLEQWCVPFVLKKEAP